MILTNCAACAAPLAHDAPRCVLCLTRYCNLACQTDHFRRGHEQICETIHRGGGVEQYYADKKYKEAVAAAVEKCADDTKGQTCYICYGEGDEEEGLVRGCSCRGESGFAHISCLARQAEVAVERGGGPGFDRWYTCGLCEQEYHGVVRCALGWACWKSYVGRPEDDWARGWAFGQLGNGLSAAGHHEDALSAREAELSTKRRLGAKEESILIAQNNLANSYRALGRHESALRLQLEVYSGFLKLKGEDGLRTLQAANNYAKSLILHTRFGLEEAKSVLRKTMPVARRVFGESNDLALRMRCLYAAALYQDPAATLNDMRESVTMLEETGRTAQRVLGGTQPVTTGIEDNLRRARATLRARETPPPTRRTFAPGWLDGPG